MTNTNTSSSARLLALVAIVLVLVAVHACVTTVLSLQARLLGPGLQHTDTQKENRR